MARPSSYTEETADILCEEIAQGAALYRLCAEHDDLPAERTVYLWLEKYPEFVQKYTRARDRQQDRESDHIIEIADTDPDPQRARVRIDARKWRASKLAPKKYGDKVENTFQGPGGGPIEVARIERIIVDGPGRNAPDSDPKDV